jgi:bifunctional non-homologous end joining protein LigD
VDLTEYERKRRSGETPEPFGGRSEGKALRFVVQKHQASRLHYDFRLELDGVLKSWAVPKGPSLDPEVKRLAMMVEDHPYDYKDFEGTIPAGNYGAGAVMVWDEGTYISAETDDPEAGRKKLKAGLQKGDLKFILHGQKLSGEFVLARMNRGESGNEWLLMKKRDNFATSEDVTTQDRSIKTGRSIEEIADEESLRKDPSPRPREKVKTLKRLLSDAPKAPMPQGVRPMLATLSPEAFEREGWIYEVKWDGYRAVAEVRGDTVRLYSRNLLDFNEKYPAIVKGLEGFGHEAVLDGEVVAVDESGRSSFQLLQQFHQTGRGNLLYYVFDLLHLDGHDLTGLPLMRRKEILERLLPIGRVRYSEYISGDGLAFYEAARGQGLEGIMAKEGESTYRPGRRTKSWLKVKTHRRQEAVIAGFTAPRGSRKRLGALVLGVYEDDELTYIGHTGGGFNERSLREIYEQLRPLERSDSPFRVIPKTNAPVTWVEPRLVAEVSFQEWTADGHMRQPIFIGLRLDKDPREVRREGVEEAVVSKGDKQTTLIDGHAVRLTHQDKVYWPRDGYTKGDLVAYYREIAPVILPYLQGRPESLHRHPDGIEGESFFQKDVDHQPPDWVRTEEIYSESNKKDINYLVCEDEASLAYLANLGCIELNPWHSRVGKLERPDYLLIDLDPEEIGFDEVVRVAQTIHRILERAEVASYPKTSGATGLHICVPLGANYDYDQAKQFAQLIATLAHAELPETTSLERSPKKRQGKVYLDYLQNRYGQTMAAPYCVRPRPGAPVSTPLAWKEVKKGLDPAKFTIRTIHTRLEKKGDLWEPVLGPGVDLAKALDGLSGV